MTVIHTLHQDRVGDLADHDDVEALLRRFYGQVLCDELLAEPFAEMAQRGLENHLPVMCDFWETLLFRAGLYSRNALTAHRQVHDRTPLTGEHFVRWLTLWNTTIDQMYEGPIAEHAKIQAARIGTTLYRRVTHEHSPVLDSFTAHIIRPAVSH